MSSVTEISSILSNECGDCKVEVKKPKRKQKTMKTMKTTQRKRTHGADKEEIMYRTLGEMIVDLSKVDGTAARGLEQLSRNYSGKDIIRELELPNSSLSDAIMESSKAIGATGQEYLFVFSLVRPAWKDAKINVPVAKINTTALAKAVPKSTPMPQPVRGKVPTPSEAVEKILSDTKDKDMLLTLADSIFKDLDLGDRAPNEELGMQDMFALMTKVGGAVQEKVSSGNLDMEKLQQQAMSFCEQIKENPELQNIIQSNPVLAGMHSNVQAQTQPGPSSASSNESHSVPSGSAGIGNILLTSMMSQFQDMD